MDMAVVAFRETASPTLINRNGHDRPSRGLLWVDPATGRVHRTDLAIIEPELEARLTTWYAYDEHTKSMVPHRPLIAPPPDIIGAWRKPLVIAEPKCTMQPRCSARWPPFVGQARWYRAGCTASPASRRPTRG
jgi:hypothetical protein